jgi:hypothetical protein
MLGVICYAHNTVPLQQPLSESKEQCTEEVREVIRVYLKLENFTPRSRDGIIISESCKSWPYKPGVWLTAFAYDSGVEYEKKLIIAMISKASKQIISKYQRIIDEDAITEVGDYSLRLDTARYQLSNNTRAFGLRFNSAAVGASCAEGNWGDELTLFIPEGKSLRPVLNIALYKQESIQGCLSTQVPNAIWRDASLTISLDESGTNGFRNLKLTANITHHSNGESTAKMMNGPEYFKLHYNGTNYEAGKRPPWWVWIENFK